MSRSTIAARRSYHYDDKTKLRMPESPAISSDTAENPIEFPVRKQMDYKAVITSPGYTGYAAGTSEWQVAIEVSDQLAGTYVQVGIATIKNADEVLIPLEGSYVEDVLATAAYIRARAIKVGTPGNLSYGAFLSN